MASLYFKYGAMNCGKSTLLIQTAFNYEQVGQVPLIIKPSIDTRSGSSLIKARVGLERECIDIEKNESILDITNFKEFDVLLVDEVQFMSKSQIKELVYVAKINNKPVLCYGLKNDFKGNLFDGSAALLAYADDLQELKTLCWCGRKATQNKRLNDSKEVISVGDMDAYKPLCLEHFILDMTESESRSSKKKIGAFVEEIHNARKFEMLNETTEGQKLLESLSALNNMVTAS